MMGVYFNEYQSMLATRPEHVDAYTGTGNAHSITVGRISYLLGLRGPAVAVDTACSSSLVAVHLACQSLRLRESDLALAGGVSLNLRPGDSDRDFGMGIAVAAGSVQDIRRGGGRVCAGRGRRGGGAQAADRCGA